MSRPSPAGRGHASRPFAAALAALARVYGRRRPSGDDQLDRIVLAVLAEEQGERAAARLMGRYQDAFVDWNEVRVARPLDLAAIAPDAPAARVKRMRNLLQALYEDLGGLSLMPLAGRRPAELRAWLGRLEGVSREEIDAILMAAFDVPVMPASESLAQVLRRLGLVSRRATRAAAQRAALRGLDPASYRTFYGLAVEHAATICHAELPLCARCRLRRLCRSRGAW
jgi:endonuclease III